MEVVLFVVLFVFIGIIITASSGVSSGLRGMQRIRKCLRNSIIAGKCINCCISNSRGSLLAGAEYFTKFQVF